MCFFRRNLIKENYWNHSGGVAAYVRIDISCKMEIDLSFSNGVVELLGLHLKSENLYIVVIYRQPNDTHSGNKSGPKELKTALSRLKQNLNNLLTPTPNLVICGDFNLSHYNWSSNEPTQGASSECCMD